MKGLPLPQLTEKNGKFSARWTEADTRMRSWKRSVMETSSKVETADDAFISALRSDDAAVKWKDKAELRDLSERLRAWFARDAVHEVAECDIVIFLRAPDGAARDGNWIIGITGRPKNLSEYLRLGAACEIAPTLRRVVNETAEISMADAMKFIGVEARALREAGCRVELPDTADGEITAEAEIAAPENEVAKETKLPMKLVVKVAGEKVTREEVEFLLDQGSSTVFFRGKWIEVDRGILANALKAMIAADKGVSKKEALSMAFGFRRPRGVRITRVKGTGWFGKVLEELNGGDRFKIQATPKGFRGRLRAYQKRGFSWMDFLTARGFGALLADDMGLGKTAQTIAWILKNCGEGKRTLVVSPVSVEMNWVREFVKFAPKLKVLLHHGKNRAVGSAFVREARRYDVVVTGYPQLRSDFRILANGDFSSLVLDEAQFIKNPDTAVARATCAFPCTNRIALSGTPVENRALDLWSIEEFLNPGLLGSRGEFNRDFESPIRENPMSPALAELHKSMEPFLLRRLKSDPGIAGELGEKHEIREYCILSSEQRAQYESALARFASSSAHAGSGAMLALITDLKHICDGECKYNRLDELTDQIFDNGESALVFTQYSAVAEEIKRHLEARYRRKMPYLHGGQTLKARNTVIGEFNESPDPLAFVISLKAGGHGLNLTKATHVIHFDRWWNPAVENQATDRAHRIGQTMPVFVHLMICAGTLEDHIDVLLENKKALARDIVGAGESFLTKLSMRDFEKAISLTED